jgi:hypothetical protein
MLGAVPALPCTSAVVGRSASADGRALLWKHRDSPAQHNEVVVREDGRFLYVGVVNAGDDAGREIWMGVNAAGLAVINTASDDLVEPDLPKDGEGRLIKVILQSCATVAEVEALLALTDPGGRDVTTDLGVIDARGGAAYFEIGQKRFVRYDAEDPGKNPRGYLLRTNFAYSAPADKGGGYIRMERITELADQEWKRGQGLGLDFLLGRASLDLANRVTGIDPVAKPSPTGIIDARDTINRSSSVADAVFVGVKDGEPAFATTLWVALGQPLASLAVPVWPVAQTLPATLNGEKQATLEELADAIRLRLYPQQRGNLKHYLDARAASLLRQRLDAAQRRIFELVAARRREVAARPRGIAAAELARITVEAAALAETELRAALAALTPPAP